MKNIGIVRRIDELGRIVIPKELRNVLGIIAGDELEIYLENDLIILKKYSALLSEKDKTNKIIDSISNLIAGLLLVADKEKILTKGRYENKKLPNIIKNIILDRQNYCLNSEEVYTFDDIKIKGYYYFSPIIQNSNTNGVIILIKNNKISNEDIIFMNVLKNIIEKI